jgi:hypothetical protein
VEETAPHKSVSRILSSLGWWVVTLATLIILDDLVFGPVFWFVSLVSPLVAAALAFAASLSFQLWLIRAALRPTRGRFAQMSINKLMFGHKRPAVQVREKSLRRYAASASGALLVSLVIGGVIPIIYLDQRGSMNGHTLRKLGLATSVIYAIEFSLIHGGYGLGGVLRWLV